MSATIHAFPCPTLAHTGSRPRAVADPRPVRASAAKLASLVLDRALRSGMTLAEVANNIAKADHAPPSDGDAVLAEFRRAMGKEICRRRGLGQVVTFGAAPRARCGSRGGTP